MLGTNSFGLPIHLDRNAYEADGIILLNRIKPHTSFTGRYESGLLKMLSHRPGQAPGGGPGSQARSAGPAASLIPEVGAFLLEKAPVALGRRDPRECPRRDGPDRRRRARRHPRGRAQAARRGTRALMARLPFDQIDVLVVGELGKNYSGTGLDPNVIGRQRVETMPDLPRPVITRLAVLDLSHETRGNALGIGLADLTTERLVRGIDPTPMRVNSLTSNFLTRARVPLALPTDRDVIATSLDTCWRIDRAGSPDGPDSEHARADHPLGHPGLEGRRSRPTLSSASRATFARFRSTEHGNLEQEELFPESQRARRQRS